MKKGRLLLPTIFAILATLALSPPLLLTSVASTAGVAVPQTFGTIPAVVHNSTLTSPNPQQQGDFGFSVATSGKITAVGALYETVNGFYDAGRVYTFNATTGALITTLTSPNVKATDHFGQSIAISGNMVLVGSPFETSSGLLGAGNVYLFNAKTGALIRTLTSPNVQSDGAFGFSVAMNGSIIVIGATQENAGGYSAAGRVYLFNTKTGALLRTLNNPNPESIVEFGWSVAISGSSGIVAVGAPFEDYLGSANAGHVYTFNAKTGALIKNLTSPNAQTDGYFGRSVAVNGNLIVVGAASETAAGFGGGGHAYIFNAKTGALISTLSSPNAQSGGNFGQSVAISGSVIAIGAEYETVSGIGEAGHVYLFNSNTGALTGTLTSANAQGGGEFGWSVALSGKLAVAGAPYETASAVSEAGHAYIFFFA